MNHISTATAGTSTFEITGMSCDHCVRSVTNELSTLAGVSDIKVDLPTGMVTLASDRPLVRSALVTALDEAGCTLVE